MYGVGYPVLEHGIRGDYVGWFLLVLMAAKMIATSLTIAIGGSGGAFAPSLFIGAMLGTAYGDVLHGLLPGLTAPAGAYGLVGMGAVFAGAARAPITAVIIIFELTGDYTIILPLMAAIVLATGAGNSLSRESIYTLKLRRRGIDIMRGRAANLMEVLTVADAMRPIPPGVPRNVPLNTLIERFDRDDVEALPVVDESGAYRGTVTAHDVESAVRDNALDTVAGDLAQSTPTLYPNQSLERALGLLVRDERHGLPVLATDNQSIVGWLTHRDVLRAYNARLEASLGAVEQQAKAHPPPGEGAGAEPAGIAKDASSEASVLGRLRDYRIVDLELTHDHALVGRRVKDIAWPPSTLVVAVRRGADAFTPNGQTEVQRGDRLTVLVPARFADTLADTLDPTQTETHPTAEVASQPE
jgi:CIC family chloride channel protein